PTSVKVADMQAHAFVCPALSALDPAAKDKIGGGLRANIPGSRHRGRAAPLIVLSKKMYDHLCKPIDSCLALPTAMAIALSAFQGHV
ncbi:hypothetical protein H9P43_008191, partial [Blastocladiella emersonii ATCC 22665]